MNPYYSGPPSDHFDGLRFFNPDGVDTDRSIRDVLRWKLRETAAPWPRSVPVHQTVPDASLTAGVLFPLVHELTLRGLPLPRGFLLCRR